jgi:hypothetical protein
MHISLLLLLLLLLLLHTDTPTHTYLANRVLPTTPPPSHCHVVTRCSVLRSLSCPIHHLLLTPHLFIPTLTSGDAVFDQVVSLHALLQEVAQLVLLKRYENENVRYE